MEPIVVAGVTRASFKQIRAWLYMFSRSKTTVRLVRSTNLENHEHEVSELSFHDSVDGLVAGWVGYLSIDSGANLKGTVHLAHMPYEEPASEFFYFQCRVPIERFAGLFALLLDDPETTWISASIQDSMDIEDIHLDAKTFPWQGPGLILGAVAQDGGWFVKAGPGHEEMLREVIR